MSRRSKSIADGLHLNGMILRDGDSGKVLWQSSENLAKPGVEHEARVPKKILQSRTVAREINFSSEEEMSNLRVEQRVLFKGTIIEEWKFQFGFVIPDSTNTWESSIEGAGDNMIPANLLSGNIVIETVFFDGDLELSKSRVRILYI